MIRRRGFSAVEALVSIGATSVLALGVAAGFGVVSRTFGLVADEGLGGDRLDRSMEWALDEASAGDRIETVDGTTLIERDARGIEEPSRAVTLSVSSRSLQTEIDQSEKRSLPGEVDALELSYRTTTSGGTGYGLTTFQAMTYEIDYWPTGQANAKGFDSLELVLISAEDRFRRDPVVSASLPDGWTVESESPFVVVLSGPAVNRTGLTAEIAFSEAGNWEMQAVAKLNGEVCATQTFTRDFVSLR